ncbi:TPA: phage tail protein, partial [Escherichia coli]|nr:phage tail protein [Escherichia coli]HDV1013238.1 phage tail protein [Escherichia coli]HDV1032738.1 phage tail protein [Escherichia coli]HDV1080118.1 phage tail protein [Escherichia coli]HDV1125127.1 phage tail protein [Escherichia coli]
ASRGVDVSGDNKFCTVSCRVKAPDGLRCRLRFEKYDGSAYTFLGDAYLTFGKTLTIKKTGGAANRITANAIKDPVTGWVFYEATIEAVEGESLIGAMIQYAPKEGGKTEADDYIYLATPQFENGSCASSFIITTTAPSTRASDMVNIPITNNLGSIPLSCLVEVHRNWNISPSSAPRIVHTIGVASNDEQMILAFRNPTSGNVEPLPYCQFGIKQSYTPVEVKTGGLMVAGFVCKSNYEFKCVVNGTFASTQTTTWNNPGAASQIRMGGSSGGGERHLFGHLRNLRLWHKALTDAQMGESVE